MLRILGAFVAVVGLVLASVPSLVHDPGPAVDTYAAIERRIWWGALAGFGALLIAHTQLKPWRVTIAAVVLWVTLGFLVARGIGLALDGVDSGKQWMWFGIEVAIIVVAAAYLRHRRVMR